MLACVGLELVAIYRLVKHMLSTVGALLLVPFGASGATVRVVFNGAVFSLSATFP